MAYQTYSWDVEHPIRPEHVQAGALAAPVSEDELNEILTDIQSVASEKLAKFLEDSLTHRDEGVEVLNFKNLEEVILAVHPSIWEEHLGHLDLSEEERQAVQEVYYNHSLSLAEDGYNNLQPKAIDEFQGILLVVKRPEGWGTARLATAWQLIEFAREGLRPAEILDYWIIENQEMPLEEWAADRGVEKEAVRKNIRQAKSKFQYKG
jgi:hypothetical protein